jgi:hypothetical protein
MDHELLKRLREEFELALDDMAYRLREVRRYNTGTDEPAFRDAIAAYERSRRRWLDAHSALCDASQVSGPGNALSSLEFPRSGQRHCIV